MDDLNLSRCKEDSKELLFSKSQCRWQTLEVNSWFWHLADDEWGKNEKKRLGQGSQSEKKMAAVFPTAKIVQVEQVGFLCLFPS